MHDPPLSEGLTLAPTKVVMQEIQSERKRRASGSLPALYAHVAVGRGYAWKGISMVKLLPAFTVSLSE